MKVSVIISAFNTEMYIEECLDSVFKQNFSNYDVILGIDGCNTTLKKIKELKNKYENLKVYWFEENSGPYLVFNSLVNFCDSEIISRFDADDIMLENHLTENVKLLEENKYILAQCQNFIHPDINKITKIYNPNGLITLFKKDFIEVNGFDNWRCGADSDLIKRLNINNFKITKTTIPTILRRIHDLNLTNTNNQFGFKSDYRKKIDKIREGRKQAKLLEFFTYPKEIIRIF